MTTLNLPIRLTHPLKTLLVITFLMLFALQGCGGGGGSDNGPQNAAPIFTSGTTVSSVADSITTVTGYTASATDADDDTVTFSLSGGSDRIAFNFDSDSGVLSFQTPPDFGVPADSDGNNIYEVEITATDGTASVVQRVTVTVIDDAEPTGYYINTGSASVGDGTGGTLIINDLQAIINGNRIMMMSVENELLYDGEITSINDNDFTAVFTIYTGGKDPVNGVTASGMITMGSSVTGTLTGSGVGNGTFSLLYASTNNEVADIARIDNGFNGGVLFTWGSIVGGSNVDHELTVELTGSFYTDVGNTHGVFQACVIGSASTIASITDTNLYEINALMGCLGTTGTVITNYTGLATTRNEPGTDETLVFMMTSDDYSFSSDFQ